MRVSGLVVGSRKAGTTWLYENFLADPEISVSPVVKESRFFLGAMTELQYHRLFTVPGRWMIEVDTALCYSDRVPVNIGSYTKEMNILLILRNPVEYAVSRFIHARRKGEIGEADIFQAIRNHAVFSTELDYTRMIQRFDCDGMHLRVMTYESLVENPVSFYATAKSHLTGVQCDTEPLLMEKVNVSRSARFSAFSRLLSDAAKMARAGRLHWLVNAAKRSGILKLIERPEGDVLKEDLYVPAKAAVEEFYPASLETYRKVSA